jgi:hypothetical protein
MINAIKFTRTNADLLVADTYIQASKGPGFCNRATVNAPFQRFSFKCPNKLNKTLLIPSKNYCVLHKEKF